MALKADRHELETDISFFMNETATRGGIVVFSTAGSGAAMDSSAALVTGTVASGNVPVGLLLNDMVNLDLTRQHINWHKDEVQKGGKVTLLKKGWVVTNNITGTPTAGAAAYVASNGNLTTARTLDASMAPVGRLLSLKDEDDYAKVEINLPSFVHNNA